MNKQEVTLTESELRAYHMGKNTPKEEKKLQFIFLAEPIVETLKRTEKSRGLRKAPIVVAAMLDYIDKINKEGFQQPQTKEELQAYVLQAKSGRKATYPVEIPISLLEEFTQLDVPLNNAQRYAVALVNYIVKIGETIE